MLAATQNVDARVIAPCLPRGVAPVSEGLPTCI
eukprot:SAG31_NODE_41400_length_276_cov_0.661017_1_plen_32_part_10